MLQEWSQLHEVADYIEVLQVADLTDGAAAPWLSDFEASRRAYGSTGSCS